MVVQTEQEPQTAGELIRFWRGRRGLSQLELSLDARAEADAARSDDARRLGARASQCATCSSRVREPLARRPERLGAVVQVCLAVAGEDVGKLQDMVHAAVKQAARSAQELAASKMNAAAGGLGLPGI